MLANVPNGKVAEALAQIFTKEEISLKKGGAVAEEEFTPIVYVAKVITVWSKSVILAVGSTSILAKNTSSVVAYTFLLSHAPNTSDLCATHCRSLEDKREEKINESAQTGGMQRNIGWYLLHLVILCFGCSTIKL